MAVSGLWRGEWSTKAVRWVTGTWELLLPAHLDGPHKRKNQENQFEAAFFFLFFTTHDTKHSRTRRTDSPQHYQSSNFYLYFVKKYILKSSKNLIKASCYVCHKQANMELIGNNSVTRMISCTYYITNPWQGFVVSLMCALVFLDVWVVWGWLDGRWMSRLSQSEPEHEHWWQERGFFSLLFFDNKWHWLYRTKWFMWCWSMIIIRNPTFSTQPRNGSSN